MSQNPKTATSSQDDDSSQYQPFSAPDKEVPASLLDTLYGKGIISLPEPSARGAEGIESKQRAANSR
jgi:hypothetical protein